MIIVQARPERKKNKFLDIQRWPELEGSVYVSEICSGLEDT